MAASAVEVTATGGGRDVAVSVDNKMLDELQAAAILQQDEPAWKCGNRLTIEKRRTVERIGQFILFCGLVLYLIIKLDYFFDDSQNRDDSIDIEIESTVPLPFIYVDFYNGTDIDECPIYFGLTDVDGSWSSSGLFDNDITDSVASGWDMSTIINLVDWYYGSSFVKHNYGHYTQYLFIPSQNESMVVSGKQSFYVLIYCNVTYYSIAGHRDELYEYSSLYQAFVGYYYSSSYFEGGHVLSYTLNWYRKKDNIKDTSSNYFETPLSGVYYDGDYSELSFSPNRLGIKYIYLTDHEIKDFFDVIGLAGGVYSTYSSVLKYFLVAIIWGISCGPIRCCRGIASESGPDGVAKQQLEGYLRARDETIIGLTHEIKSMTLRINRLETGAGNGHSQNQSNNNAGDMNDDIHVVYDGQTESGASKGAMYTSKNGNQNRNKFLSRLDNIWEKTTKRDSNQKKSKCCCC